MQKKVQLKNGEIILLMDKLPDLSGGKEYFKAQRQDGSFCIVETNELATLISKEKEASPLSTPQKLQLFYSYFRGRPDVYATKWKSKSGKVGFSPHGEGEWIVKDGRSRKEIHTFYPYTLQTVNDHIRTEKYDFRMGAGIYPMLENDATYLVVIDFDSEGAEEEAKAVVKICREYELDVLIERSQSGEGIHLWFFFDEEVQASKARYFAQLIIRHAMAYLDKMSFTSFDRIIPMQDKLPSNGFGNIIALPLRADKVKENKTVFLTDNFEVVEDQWEKLASISKYTNKEINLFIDGLEENLPVQLYNQENEEIDIELPKLLTIDVSGELIVDKKSISRKAMIQLAHLATFHNPEFYKLQNMRAPTWTTPQLITSASEDENYLYLPRGIKSKLKKLDIEIEFKDQLNDGHPIEVTFQGKLRENQQKAADEMLTNNTGIVSAPTGFGKTVVAAHTIAERKTSTLIIVHSKVLADQWKERLEEFLNVKSEPFIEYTPTGRVRKKDKIGELHSGKEKLSHNIDIALFQTLANREDLGNLVNQYGMVIVDEVHHVAAETFEKVIKQVNSRYLYGLTATPERKDGLTPILFMRFGEIIYEQNEELDESILIPKYFYPRFTNYSDLNPELTYGQHLKNMQDITDRNELIISDVLENIQEGRSCLVLTERVDHIHVLYEMLNEKLEKTPVYILSSRLPNSETERKIDEMQDQTEVFAVIATSKFVGEGFDLPQLESVFFCLPFSYKGRTKQYIGRLHRGLENKDELRVYDYVDIGVEMFARMYQKRMRQYSKLNYQVAEDEKTRKNQTQIYNMTNYEEVLKYDLSQSNKIVLGIYSINQIKLTPLRKLKEEGRKIEIFIKGDKIKKHSSFLEKLYNLDIKVTPLSVNPYSFIILDDKVVWYGDLRFFIQNAPEATALRLSNQEIAAKISKQYSYSQLNEIKK